jgi:hypothetical protein
MNPSQLEADIRHTIAFQFSLQEGERNLTIDREWLIEFVVKQMEHAYQLGVKSKN